MFTAQKLNSESFLYFFYQMEYDPFHVHTSYGLSTFHVSVRDFNSVTIDSVSCHQLSHSVILQNVINEMTDSAAKQFAADYSGHLLDVTESSASQPNNAAMIRWDVIRWRRNYTRTVNDERYGQTYLLVLFGCTAKLYAYIRIHACCVHRSV
jgi:hypothetical protein